MQPPLDAAGQFSLFLQNRDGDVFNVGERVESFLIELQRMQSSDYVPEEFYMGTSSEDMAGRYEAGL